MLAFHILSLAALLLYLMAAFLYVRTLSTGQGEEFLFPRGVLRAAFVFHVLLIASLFSTQPSGSAPPGGFSSTLFLVALVSVGVFLGIERRFRLASLGAFLIPLVLAALVFASVGFHLSGAAGEVSFDRLLAAHIGVTAAAHAAFFFSFGASLALLLQKRLLKQRRFTRLQKLLPSLEILDRLNGGAVAFGFIFMIAGVGLGALYAVFNRVMFAGQDPRLLWSFAVLAMYSLIVGARFLKGVTGGRAAWLSLAGFSLNVLSFFALQLFGSGFHDF